MSWQKLYKDIAKLIIFFYFFCAISTMWQEIVAMVTYDWLHTWNCYRHEVVTDMKLLQTWKNTDMKLLKIGYKMQTWNCLRVTYVKLERGVKSPPCCGVRRPSHSYVIMLCIKYLFSYLRIFEYPKLNIKIIFRFTPRTMLLYDSLLLYKIF